MFVFTRVRAFLRATRSTCAVFILALGMSSTFGLFTNVDRAQAKTPGSTYCFYGKCHRVKTLSETRAAVGKEVSLHTSHYDSCHRDRYNPCGLTSSGEPFFADRPDNAASPIYPDGTKLLVWSPQSKEAAVVRVNNAGPYWGNRKLDVSRALARKLGFEHRGVAKLNVRVLSAPTRAEARYKRNRRYDKVQGPIGKFANLDEAEKGLAVLLAFEAMTTASIAPAGGGAVTHIDQPFDVAGKVTQGRAFAEVRPEFKQWPVVGRQFAAVEWPVVGARPAQSRAAPVQVASVLSDSSDDAAPIARVVPLKSRPVVKAPQIARNDIPVIRAAFAWPVVKVVPQAQTRGLARFAQGKSTQPQASKKVAALPTSRTVRLTASKSKQQRKVRLAKRSSQARKLRSARVQKRKTARKTRRVTSRTKVARKSKTKVKSKLIAKSQTTTSKLPVARRVKPSLAQRPHVATRQILHRALGRGA